MKIFLDSAKLDEIVYFSRIGVIEGVTTNPTLIKQAMEEEIYKGNKVDLYSHIVKILENVGRGRSVSLEVVSGNYDEMVREALVLYKKFNRVAKNVYIKIPICTSDFNMDEGLRAINHLSSLGIPVNCTLIFTPEQALLAAKSGAKIVSLFVGRLDDLLREKAKIKFRKEDYFPSEGVKYKGKILSDNGIKSGADLVYKTYELFRHGNVACEILAASVRNSLQVRECFLRGADIVTAPFSVIISFLKHEKTKEGVKKFTEDSVQEYKDLLK